jgi:hypothetical protein
MKAAHATADAIRNQPRATPGTPTPTAPAANRAGYMNIPYMPGGGITYDVPIASQILFTAVETAKVNGKTAASYFTAEMWSASIGALVSATQRPDPLATMVQGARFGYRYNYTTQSYMIYGAPYTAEFGTGTDTAQIIRDAGERWATASDAAERTRLFELAETAKQLARANMPYMYGNDRIMDTLHENAKTGEEMMAAFIENAFLSGLYGKPYDPHLAGGGWLALMAIDSKNGWDYKLNDAWRVPILYAESDGRYAEQSKVDANWQNWMEWIYFNGNIIGADQFGNINLAYVGVKMGLAEWIVSNFETRDDARDIWATDYGLSLARAGT